MHRSAAILIKNFTARIALLLILVIGPLVFNYFIYFQEKELKLKEYQEILKKITADSKNKLYKK